MSKKFDFISGIEQDAKKPKTKYQVFEAEMGIERAEVLIPFEQADDFLTEVTEQKPKSTAALKKIASKFGGTIQ
jgi:hypothetical protein